MRVEVKTTEKGEILRRTVRKFGGSGHVIVPKRLIESDVVVISGVDKEIKKLEEEKEVKNEHKKIIKKFKTKKK